MCVSRQNKKLQLILGYAVRGVRKRQALINPIISPLACLMCHAVNFPHSAKTTVRKNVAAPPPPAAAVRVLHACIDRQRRQQVLEAAKGSRRRRQWRLHKALQLTLLQLSRAATAVATIGIGLISMDSACHSAQPRLGSVGRAVYLVRSNFWATQIENTQRCTRRITYTQCEIA